MARLRTEPSLHLALLILKRVLRSNRRRGIPVVMPFWLDANTEPLCILAMALTMDSPRPWLSQLLARAESTR